MTKISPEGLQFLRLGVADLPEAVQLEKRCFTMPWSDEQFRKAFEQKNFAAFGLRCPQGLVAYISIYHAAGELEILNIAVDPVHRRQGHGKSLLQMMLQVARKMGIERAVLEVRRHNIPALALYQGLGFAQAGVRRGYYADTGEDALIYQYMFV